MSIKDIKEIEKAREQEIRAALNEAIKSPKHSSMFALAASLDDTVGELIDEIENSDDTIKMLFARYQNEYKHWLLDYSFENKVKDLFLPLLKESGIVDAENNGNDLELNLVINDISDLKINEVPNEENVSRETLEELEWEED